MTAGKKTEGSTKSAKSKNKRGTKPKGKSSQTVKRSAGKSVKPKKRGKRSKFSRKRIEHFKKKILAERERILGELERIEEAIKEASEGQEGYKQNYSNHLADLGTDYMEKEKNFYYASQEGHYLRSLEEALQRIERGEYGVCQNCGDFIPLKRLEAVPSARLCLTCKSENENRGRGR